MLLKLLWIGILSLSALRVILNLVILKEREQVGLSMLGLYQLVFLVIPLQVIRQTQFLIHLSGGPENEIQLMSEIKLFVFG